jgi:glycogen synthase
MTTVLMTTDAVGGVWTYSLDLTRELSRRGVDVVLAIVGPRPSSHQRAQLASCGAVATHELPHALEWTDDPWPEVDEAAVTLLELDDKVRPDVVHLNGYSHGSLPWNAPVVVVAHSDVLSWWRAVRDEPAPARWSEYARRVRAGMASADAIVAPTRAVLDAMAVEYEPLPRPDVDPVTDPRILRVIPNGRSREWVVHRHKKPMILCAGRIWDPAKNVAALAAVAPSLDWPIYVAGGDHIGDGGTSEDSGLRSLGRLGFAELSRHLAEAAIYASPARYEPFGLAVLEAAMCGCALVLGDIASLREVWGDAATYVPPDDHVALRDALQVLIRDTSRRRELGRRARDHARRYDLTATAGAYLDLYGSLHRRQQMSTSHRTVGART